MIVRILGYAKQFDLAFQEDHDVVNDIHFQALMERITEIVLMDNVDMIRIQKLDDAKPSEAQKPQ